MAPPYSPEECSRILRGFHLCGENAAETARWLQREYPHGRHPNSSRIRAICRRFRADATLTRRPGSGRPARPETTDEDVLAYALAYPASGSRRIATEAGLSQRTVIRILRRHRYHPYHRHVLQFITEVDHRLRFDFANWALLRVEANRDVFSDTLFTDECTFAQEFRGNTHNAHRWAAANPHWVRTANNQVRWSANVWCGIMGRRLIGPYFLPHRLNGARYVNFLENDLTDRLDDLPLAVRRRMFFQHDGAPAHSHRDARAVLDREFPGRWIGRHGAVHWPARSPDLNPCDFFLWGYLRAVVYEPSSPANLEELRARIRAACAGITEDMMSNVQRNFIHRLHACIAADGGHFEHSLP